MILLDSVLITTSLPPPSAGPPPPPRLHRTPTRHPTSLPLPTVFTGYATLCCLKPTGLYMLDSDSVSPDLPPSRRWSSSPAADTPRPLLGSPLTVFTYATLCLFRKTPPVFTLPKLSCLIRFLSRPPSLHPPPRPPPPPRLLLPNPPTRYPHPSAVYPDATPQPPFGSAPLLPVLLYRRKLIAHYAVSIASSPRSLVRLAQTCIINIVLLISCFRLQDRIAFSWAPSTRLSNASKHVTFASNQCSAKPLKPVVEPSPIGRFSRLSLQSDNHPRIVHPYLPNALTTAAKQGHIIQIGFFRQDAIPTIIRPSRDFT
ncbi:hypothetical protein B0H13DRAFT_2389711 [Mycena leptocephala]|nr:hypothetical protein B0H13DRAFT_2389711 [Mycena leptocephala]